MKRTICIILSIITIFSLLLTYSSCQKVVEENNGTNGYESGYSTSEIGGVTDKATEAPNGTDKATDKPTEKPTEKPTDKPADEPSDEPTDKPSDEPTDEPTDKPSDEPTTPTVTPTVNINGTSSEWDMNEGISKLFTTKSNASETKFEVNIPVSEAGSYELGFETSLGFTRTFSSGSKKASLSLPKTVFKEGEPIPLAYSTSGLTVSGNNAPWLCITKSVGGVDKYICWEYVKGNSSGILDATIMTGAREDNSVQDYVWFPAGEYKIYFIDDSYAHVRNSSYWLHSDPINISIVPDTTVGTTVKREGNMYGKASLSVANNIFCKGANIAMTYTANSLTAPGASKVEPWVALAKTVCQSTGLFDYYTHWVYTDTTASGNIAFTATNGNSPQNEVKDYKSLPLGSYKIYYVHGSNLQTGIEYVEAIGINIAEAYTIKASVGSTSVLNTSNPYNINTVKKAITVTDADVAKGYITVSFDLSALAANTQYFLNVNSVSLAKK